MAIAFDAGSGSTSGTLSTTVAHTCSGSNLFLMVGQWVNGPGDISTGVTYNGVAMSLLTKVNNVGSAANQWIYIYGMLNPPTGSHNIVGSCSSAQTYVVGASYTGVNQSALPSIVGSNAVSSTSVSVSLTTTVDNSWLAGFSYTSSTPPTAGSNTTLRQSSNGYSGLWIIDSNGPKTPTGSYNLNLTQSPSGFMGMVACAIAPSASITVNSNFLAFM